MHFIYKAIVNAYIHARRQPELDELEFFEKMPNLDEAINKAAAAVDKRGKRQLHQRRLKKAILEQSRDTLIQIKQKFRDIRNFDELHSAIEGAVLPIHGIGELYVYDTALRIGAYLKKLPSKVYLHAGTRLGAKRLGYRGKGPIELAQLPKEFQSLPAHQVEDILCIYKSYFGRPRTNMPVALACTDSVLCTNRSCGSNVRKRRRC